MDRRKTGEVIFSALKCAIQDRESLIDAYGHSSDTAVINARKDIKAFNRLLINLFGTNKSMLDNIIENSELVTLPKLKNILDEEVDYEN